MILISIRSIIAGSGSERVHAYLELARRLKKQNLRTFANVVHRRLERRYGVYISIDAEVPRSTRFPHPVGIVIGRGVCLGENVTIFQNVTIGGRRLGDGRASRYPKLDDNTTVFAGAVIVGDVRVGEGSTIGANSVVLGDIPPLSVAVGVPALSRPVQPIS